ncbi:uncharacterized protein CDAR_617001 [Caerostris darwini]|uniref:RNase H type-1 domain-containing protein n=1 Tax=Caerostris darwini TaxID=1538125 RepID=A0AAV4NVT9_9ARAC|nr:uncharacterized protein CDAR_617001 [Caerostris darwini]
MITAPASYLFTNKSKAVLDKISNWTRQNLMTINNLKSFFTILSNKKYTHIPSIKIDGNNIKYTKELKYLGLIIDPRLSWHKHLASIQDKVHKLQHKFYRISRAIWGLNPQVKKDLYNKVTDRIIAYGHEIWFQNKSKQNIKLLQLQRSGLISVTKCYKTVSTHAIQVLAGNPPIDIKLKLSLQLHNFKHHKETITIQNTNYVNHAPSQDPRLIAPWDKMAFKWNYYREDTAGTQIFTDECLLLLKLAILYAAEQQLPVANIITDSRSVLLAVDNPSNCDPNILEIKRLLANHRGTIRLFWIKAHAGFFGNERADEYAKQATTKDTIDIDMDFDIPFVKKLLKNELNRLWQIRWSASTKGREVFALLSTVRTARIQGDFFINQLFTGHGAIGLHQERFFRKSSSCSCGQQLEDQNHVIYSCTKWIHIRNAYFPPNHHNTKMDLLLFNKKSRQGLQLIMEIKLKGSIQLSE